MKSKISSYAFSKIYPMYIQKVEKKGHTKENLDRVIYWLTGYDEQGLTKIKGMVIIYSHINQTVSQYN